MSRTTEQTDEAEFDRFAGSYDQLLHDPLRTGFAADPLHFSWRKWRVLHRALLSLGRQTESMSWLDVGCGRGELLELAGTRFAYAAGCDPSAMMLGRERSFDMHKQRHASELPFPSCAFDLVTAVCVYHHVPGDARVALTREIRRVLRPDGLVCLIEHNPHNPVTRKIVTRCPVDVDAQLLSMKSADSMLREAGFRPCAAEYFLYIPEKWFYKLSWMENFVSQAPFGGQYALLAQPHHR